MKVKEREVANLHSSTEMNSSLISRLTTYNNKQNNTKQTIQQQTKQHETNNTKQTKQHETKTNNAKQHYKAHKQNIILFLICGIWSRPSFIIRRRMDQLSPAALRSFIPFIGGFLPHTYDSPAVYPSLRSLTIHYLVPRRRRQLHSFMKFIGGYAAITYVTRLPFPPSIIIPSLE